MKLGVTRSCVVVLVVGITITLSTISSQSGLLRQIQADLVTPIEAVAATTTTTTTTTTSVRGGAATQRAFAAAATPGLMDDATELLQQLLLIDQHSNLPAHHNSTTSGDGKLVMHPTSFAIGQSLVATDENEAQATSTTDAGSSRGALEDAVRETTRILYRDSPDLDAWLAAPLPKIYVYETLPEAWSNVTMISRCIDEKFLGYTLSNKPRRSWGNCFWEPRVCDETDRSRNKYMRKTFMLYRANYNSDVTYQRWFQEYLHRTYNASEADFFVVPYPHWSHCICSKNMSLLTTKCTYGYEEIEREVISKLAYYPDNKERHLFLYGVDHAMVRPNVRNHLDASMTISLGASCSGRLGQLCGHFVTPYSDTSSAYQPDAVRALPLDWWTARNRTHAVGAALSTTPGFDARLEFIINRTAHLGDGVGGLPIRAIDLQDFRRQMLQSQLRAVYNESIFCPVLPGDDCPQKRFFDVILNGCIPVVPSFYPSDEEGYPTFWVGKGKCSIRRTYPWSKGTFYGDDDAGIDYQSLVVQFNGTCGIPCMKPALEKVLSNATELERLQTGLREFAKLISFGIGENMYRRADAFTAMLVSIRHYLFHLRKAGGS